MLIGALVILGGAMQGDRAEEYLLFVGSMALALAPVCGVHGYE